MLLLLVIMVLLLLLFADDVIVGVQDCVVVVHGDVDGDVVDAYGVVVDADDGGEGDNVSAVVDDSVVVVCG